MVKLFLPSFKNLLLLIVFTFFIFQKIYDADIWWHLKTGELIWNTHTIPRFDVFSYTNFGQVWVAHEWLSELIFYVIYQLGGWPGLVIWQSLMVTGILYVLDKIMILRGVRTPYRLIGLLLTISGTIAFWLTRPHLWTWLFLLILILILEKKKNLWLIPLLFIFWANLHTGYVVGLVVLGIYTISLLISFGEDYGTGALALANKAGRRWLIGIGYLTLLACLLNPNGINIFFFPLTFATGQLPNYKYVQEWAPPTIKLVPVFFVMLLGFIFLNRGNCRDSKFCVSTDSSVVTNLRVFTDKSRKIIDNLCLAIFMILAFTAVRHVALFVLVTMPYFCWLLQNVVDRGWRADIGETVKRVTVKRKYMLPLFEGRFRVWLMDRLANINKMDAQVSGWVTVGMIVFFVGFLSVSGRIPVRIADENFPVQAVQYIQDHQLKGNLFHHYNWGGYLIWKLWPEQKVFIDGRNEVHGLRFLEDEYLELINLGPKWQTVLDKYQIRYVLLPKKEPLVQMLKVMGGWQVVYSDEQSVILGN